MLPKFAISAEMEEGEEPPGEPEKVAFTIGEPPQDEPEVTTPGSTLSGSTLSGTIPRGINAHSHPGVYSFYNGDSGQLHQEHLNIAHL